MTLTIAKVLRFLKDDACSAAEIAEALGTTPEKVRVFVSPYIGHPVGARKHGPLWSFRRYNITRSQAYHPPPGRA
ncbi:hypothetical protein HN803_00600 [candidate division WWE3 bacterium]|nr:hypothetical protein [candidate division WWE3 bacterium]MBT7349280.1 hypothetical protein [candidate division WWE3 bacterium]